MDAKSLLKFGYLRYTTIYIIYLLDFLSLSLPGETNPSRGTQENREVKLFSDIVIDIISH